MDQSSTNEGEVQQSDSNPIQPSDPIPLSSAIDPQTQEYLEQAGIDLDLWASSCMGINVHFPDLWNIIKRYILRGDEWFQLEGLSVLASSAWHMPLQEAADVLEEYFAKHNYMPDGGPRGGVNLSALAAVYKVATVYGYNGDESDLEGRRGRMITLLGRYKKTLSENEWAEDVPAIQETMEAIVNERVNFAPRFPPFTSAQDDDNDPNLRITISDNQSNTNNSSLHLTQDSPLPVTEHLVQQENLSAMNVITLKHGYEMLQQNIMLNDKRTDERFANFEKSIDRYLSERQERVGKTQVHEQRRANAIGLIAIMVSLLSIGLSLYVYFYPH